MNILLLFEVIVLNETDWKGVKIRRHLCSYISLWNIPREFLGRDENWNSHRSVVMDERRQGALTWRYANRRPRRRRPSGPGKFTRPLALKFESTARRDATGQNAFSASWVFVRDYIARGRHAIARVACAFYTRSSAKCTAVSRLTGARFVLANERELDRRQIHFRRLSASCCDNEHVSRWIIIICSRETRIGTCTILCWNSIPSKAEESNDALDKTCLFDINTMSLYLKMQINIIRNIQKWSMPF